MRDGAEPRAVARAARIDERGGGQLHLEGPAQLPELQAERDEKELFYGAIEQLNRKTTSPEVLDAALEAAGARAIVPFGGIEGRSAAFVTPALLDVTGVTVPDEEIFAPVLQVVRVADFDAAITAANDTRFGLSAGLLTDDDALWERFVLDARAGVVNRNRPTTGAAGAQPFGGIGEAFITVVGSSSRSCEASAAS